MERDTRNGIEAPSGEAVVAPLTYTLHLPEKLIYQITEMGEDEDSPEYHKWYDVRNVAISDGWPDKNRFALDREGFVLDELVSSVDDFYDEDKLTNVYEPEVRALVRDVTGAKEVLVFDHTIRVESDDLRRERRVREIVNLVHNDYTATSGPQRVRDLLGETVAEERMTGRFAIYNLWKSIAGTVQSTPLGLCEAQSVKSEDWVPAGLDYGDRIGEIYNIAYNPDHRWRYFPELGETDILIFKNFDSCEDGRSRFTPHSAFADPTSAANAPSRQSIETRTLAFFES